MRIRTKWPCGCMQFIDNTMLCCNIGYNLFGRINVKTLKWLEEYLVHFKPKK